MFKNNLHVQTAEYLGYVICSIFSVHFFIPCSLGQILFPFTAVQSLGLTHSQLLWDASDIVNDAYE